MCSSDLGAMGTSTVTTLWENRATLHHAHMTERLTSGDLVTTDALNALTSSGLSWDQALAQVNRLIDQQAFTRAADDVYLGSAILFLCLIPLIWLSRPQKLAPGTAPPDGGGAH